MIEGYTKNRSIQILIALLKKHGIKYVITSPGGTNLEINAGLQYDGSFNMYSSVDERSAAYMACGMAGETGEAVAITCTEATASRDYFPGITEAFYRKLPIIVITGVHRYSQIGHLKPQVIDRSISPSDTFICKVQLPVIKDEEDIWTTEIMVNKAILALRKNGGGPVHIDLPCCNDDYDFSTKELPEVKVINRFYEGEVLPKIPNGKIAIFMGAHRQFSKEDTLTIDAFCASHNVIVFADHTSGYYGKYAVHAAVPSLQNKDYDLYERIELLIHMGESYADEATVSRLRQVKTVWRVSPDGELRDTFKKLSNVFEMTEIQFFKHFIIEGAKQESNLIESKHCIDQIIRSFDSMPFSNIYIASVLASQLPLGSVIHLGLSNSVRAWSVQELPKSVTSSCNVGCRGIDGVLSTFIGASLINTTKLYFCVLGDLTFFYDMNVLGNRSIGKNIRIIMINNNGGSIFKQSAAPGYKFFGDKITNKFIAASGHFGNKSFTLVKHFVEDLGFEYISASNKEEFHQVYLRFVEPQITDKPIFFEVFTENEDERNAFSMLTNLETSNTRKAKNLAKQILGDTGTKFVKKIISK